MRKLFLFKAFTAFTLLSLVSCNNKASTKRTQKNIDTSYQIWAEDSSVIYFYEIHGKDTSVKSPLNPDWKPKK